MKNIQQSLLNKPINIYWFSGSGNTLLIAMEIRDCLVEISYTVNLVPLEKTDPALIDTKAVVGFVISIAGQSTFPFIWEFFEKLPESVENTPCFFADTMLAYSGGILGPLKKILKKKGWLPFAAKEIRMPNNFLRKKDTGNKDKLKIENGKKAARAFCSKMLAGKARWIDIPGYSDLMSIFYRKRKIVALEKKMFPLKINHDKCTRCGICVKLCPEKALVITDNTLVRSDRCSLCTRCFQFCPSDAISIGNKTYMKYRAVSLKELQSHLSGK